MARQHNVANRYAKAIFEQLGDAEKVRLAVDELEAFSALVEGNSELKLVLSSKVFSESDRQGVVEDLAEKLKLSSDTRRALLVISQLKRLSQLKGIADRLRWLMLQSANVIPVRVDSAADLGADEKSSIEKKFTGLLGKKVEATYVVDPALIGGIRVTAEGRTFDGSLAGWLTTFEEQLVGGQG